MNSFLQAVTDRVTSKKGMWITLGIWLLVTILLSVLSPSTKEYEVSSKKINQKQHRKFTKKAVPKNLYLWCFFSGFKFHLK
ncbi:preprotein translocase subunit SecG [Neobacillus niacini]|uniref:hypothetical protein n=1 Tax=Neobacillus niacini TaxID=86668 RepID=UPI002782F887|nr:hypothetical protein [Neobacillus niacini]MDQ1004495.1 preprotein translocase subunit SecG [Neobacillus niacini]